MKLTEVDLTVEQELALRERFRAEQARRATVQILRRQFEREMARTVEPMEIPTVPDLPGAPHPWPLYVAGPWS